jgi:hypothetical protein
MQKLNRDDLYSLEQYADVRPDFRNRVLEHKKHRRIQVGPHAVFYFEDRLTIQYQVQEMLRVERIFEAEGIEDELEAYNPLIPDGSNWKATFMLEYADAEERRQALAQLVGIEERLWVQIEGCERVWAIADEDLERSTEDKTSAVHFLRFELTSEMVELVKNGAAISLGIDHPGYSYQIDDLAPPARESLLMDLH